MFEKLKGLFKKKPAQAVLPVVEKPAARATPRRTADTPQRDAPASYMTASSSPPSNGLDPYSPLNPISPFWIGNGQSDTSTPDCTHHHTHHDSGASSFNSSYDGGSSDSSSPSCGGSDSSSW